MKAELVCYYCCMRKADMLLAEYRLEEPEKIRIMKEVFFQLATAKEDGTAPVLMAKVMRLLKEQVGIINAYDHTKTEYNELLLSKEAKIVEKINSSEDKLLAALQYAMVGNYIDFGAMDSVDHKKLEELLDSAVQEEINEDEIKAFKNQLKTATQLVYITDNAGEIVLDKIFIKIIKELYTALNILVIVRGAPILNDATIKDAQAIGLTKITEVIPNGTDIPGTQLEALGDRAKEIIEKADLIISKGQGNFETLFGCDLNIYYIFLCKCDLFMQKFQMDRFKGVFVNEKNL
ncbi:MAG TPA: hypothetical protein DDZ91_09425 [Firmicutes bacterium]|nr:hypothetical protein [Bacillota bacterium]